MTRPPHRRNRRHDGYPLAQLVIGIIVVSVIASLVYLIGLAIWTAAIR